MNNSGNRMAYSCDFRSSDGSQFFGYQTVTFSDQPTYIVTVGDIAFKKVLQTGNFLVYLQVPIFDLSSQVSINE